LGSAFAEPKGVSQAKARMKIGRRSFKGMRVPCELDELGGCNPKLYRAAGDGIA